MMPAIPLYPYQRQWVADRSRFKIGMWARQTGKTFTTTLELVDDVFEGMVTGERRRWVILSRGERQAKEAMDTGVKPHAKAYGLALDSIEYEFLAPSGISYKALEVGFDNGSKITALPANPDTARGFSANVFLDEFAIHQHSRAIWTALFPVISAGWKMRVTSTPNGKGNKFYELMTGEGGDWSKHVVDIYRAVADGLPRNVDELRRNLMDEDAWAQEFELKWLDEASAWLPYELISSCEHPDAGRPELYTGRPCFLGNDIARRNNLWVAWVVEPIGDVYWTREIRALRNATFREHDDVLDEMVERYNVARLCMDQTGMGEKPVEDAQRRYGSSRVEGVLMTAPNKLVLATGGKEAFEDRKVRIPEGDAPLRADLHKLKKVSSETGSPRFVADDDSEGHADRAWSCFLALHAAGDGTPSYDYRPASSSAGRARLGEGAGRGSFDRPRDDDDAPAMRGGPFGSRGAW
ncbi:MAG: terminase family protein [Alphaproteobacteria bacterium]